jgi:membrane protein implicated in regulation of membrane protease activity
MFLLLALLLLIFLPDPWNLAAAFASAGVGALEILYWERRMRGHKVQTGVENLVGAVGKVTEPLAPIGQIRVHGELWEARSTVDTQVGSPVRVLAVDGLTLKVEPDFPAEDA